MVSPLTITPSPMPPPFKISHQSGRWRLAHYHGPFPSRDIKLEERVEGAWQMRREWNDMSDDFALTNAVNAFHAACGWPEDGE